MIKAVVFDLDDTLISEKEYIKSGFKVVSSKLAKEHNLNSKVTYNTMFELFNESYNNVFNRLLDKLNINYDIKYIKELIDIYRNHMPEIELYKDGKEIIEYLYNNEVKLGMITDGYQITQRNKLKVLDIEKYFDCIVVTDELGREYWKPHIKPYEIVKKSLKLEYEEMIYIGDNAKKDFITPKKLGMETVIIRRDNGVYFNIEIDDKYNAKYEINNLNEIASIFDFKVKLGVY